MALVRMAFENYRCFKDRQEIELRPITLVLGKNNAGKSAVTRFPLIIQTGLNTGSDLPLDLDQLGDDPPEFLDLVHGKSPHRPLKMEFSVDRDPFHTVRATIQNIAEKSLQVVSYLCFSGNDANLELRWTPEKGGTIYNANGEDENEFHLNFRGILPRGESFSRPRGSEKIEILHNFDPSDADYFFEPFSSTEGIRHNFGQVRYLGPYRQRPPRYVRLPSRLPREVGPMGENAPGMLANDHVRSDGHLIAKVNELLGDSLAGWQFEVVSQGATYAINLRSIDDPALSVNILDSGTGVAQVLPLLVQQAQDLAERLRGDVLQVIEEPELHLHPAFHPLLADLFITAAKKGSRFLVETHSENLLLRMRRRIAEKKFSADDVAVYFVEHEDGASHVRRVGIDEFGNLDYWPSGVFSEDFEETRELAKAQFDRERDAG
ncbi:hypothetical protein GCM10009678_31430 [Actinomadura kijaniata]|uniref:DUF3696 domain-containing protein n=1 Tax=Actinomadura namibiensis TaxID=182080 RepID=A0A7W3QIW4_ACTNM|nr:DUF3696 domain-containing protein [Actinomadura namibiensis]MBA8948715.1 hypothetical protein [Actinomadura namibiensis]